ncbi:MAG: BLUF domain-containing protein [Betaproteobacteria bacterium]|nr:BLUF domain-containing protein [Betaproteobacteria bacterium]NDA06112.1 BLUF domain-containing protein [Betaproteobacteria bacterium]NDB12638.1 BLUF domain-containing protein [Betaproteobacteria bacterium]NDH35196.1 BLUF domain-containing protein [Betaproteobacteria bacterium]
MTWAATTLKCITKGFHLLRITYISEESKPFSISALLELLQQCHINNPRLGLTGLLIYGNGTFLQSIEGEDEAVKSIVDKISQDQRHRGFKILRKELATERFYTDWSMRFERLTEESLRKVPGLREFAIKKFNRDYLDTHVEIADLLIDSHRPAAQNPALDKEVREKQIVELRHALDACQQRQQMAALLIESVMETGKHSRLDNTQLRLCNSMLNSMRKSTKGRVRPT